MNPKLKKGLIIAGITLDILIVIFLFVVSIIMLATLPQGQYATKELYYAACDKNGPFIGYLQKNPSVYLLSCVLPLIILLAANIILLILYVKKAGKKPAVELSELSEEEKEALKAELLKDISKDSK